MISIFSFFWGFGVLGLKICTCIILVALESALAASIDRAQFRRLYELTSPTVLQETKDVHTNDFDMMGVEPLMQLVEIMF